MGITTLRNRHNEETDKTNAPQTEPPVAENSGQSGPDSSGTDAAGQASTQAEPQTE